jgi:tetratricopeptide (TPR) repeat protein
MTMRFWLLFVLVTSLTISLLASPGRAYVQQGESGKPAEKAEHDRRADREAEAHESSSRDTKIDISPPKDDAKTHPNSSSALEEVEGKPSGDDVQEFHPWNPLKALKDVEVGDFYFKRKNYRAALDRYKEALYYKQNDAIATFRAAQCQEKLGSVAEALANYEAYLRILPEGPFASDAQKSIERLSGSPGAASAKKN